MSTNNVPHCDNQPLPVPLCSFLLSSLSTSLWYKPPFHTLILCVCLLSCFLSRDILSLFSLCGQVEESSEDEIEEVEESGSSEGTAESECLGLLLMCVCGVCVCVCVRVCVCVCVCV